MKILTVLMSLLLSQWALASTPLRSGLLDLGNLGYFDGTKTLELVRTSETPEVVEVLIQYSRDRWNCMRWINENDYPWCNVHANNCPPSSECIQWAKSNKQIEFQDKLKLVFKKAATLTSGQEEQIKIVFHRTLEERFHNYTTIQSPVAKYEVKGSGKKIEFKAK